MVEVLPARSTGGTGADASMARARGLDASRALMAIGAIALIALPGIAIAAGEPFWIKIATRMAIFALAASALNLIVGYGGLVSLGHSAFLGVGAYVVGITAQHHGDATPVLGVEALVWSASVSALVQWPLALLAGGVFAAIIGALSLRTAGVYFIMITLAFAQMIYFFMVGLPTYGGEDGMNIWDRTSAPFIDLADPTTFYYVCVALLFAFTYLAHRLLQAPFGLVLQAIKHNDRRLQALGVGTYAHKLAAFTLSGAVTALAGALLAHHTEYVDPGLLQWTVSGELLIMVVLGGMGTLCGPILGAFALLALEEVLSGLTEHWMLFLGPILVIVVLYARQGLWGLLSAAARAGAGRGGRPDDGGAP